MGLKIRMPEPNGGRLVDRVVKKREVGEKWASGCPSFDIKPTTRNGAPIRNVYREIVSTCYGFFSPVDGSMTQNDVERILKERRLENDCIFPYPLVFDISDEDLNSLDVGEGDRLLLKLKGQPFAILDIEEKWKMNTDDVATRTFGTPKDNPEVVQEEFNEKHPGYMIYKHMEPNVLSGKYTIVNPPKFRDPFDRFWYPPAECRKEFQKKGWRTAIAHQTRNVPHVGHEFLMKNAAYMGDTEPCNGILVNAIMGAKRLGDYPDEAIIEAHGATNEGNYIKPDRHMVSFTLWDMRYGNPIESLLHAIIRQNMGCSWHMWGRDHAAVGDFYDEYATQKLWDEGIPSFGFEAPPYEVYAGLKMRPQNMQEFWYCPVCGEIAYKQNCGHIEEKQKFSGSFIRGMVSEGVFPPKVIMRPEVYKAVVKWWKIFNYPFVNNKYLEYKNTEGEFDLEPMDVSEKR
ncbi:MAG: sulfate adenylyltransferase [Archaeoglobaceae archaeon]